MSKGALLFNNEQEEENKVVDLKLITGGKEPPSTGSDWLSNLELGTVFYAQHKVDSPNYPSHVLELFRLDRREGKVVILQMESPLGPKRIPVNSVRFCNRYSLFHEVMVITTEDLIKEQEEKEIANDDGDRLEPATGDPKGTVE